MSHGLCVFMGQLQHQCMPLPCSDVLQKDVQWKIEIRMLFYYQLSNNKRCGGDCGYNKKSYRVMVTKMSIPLTSNSFQHAAKILGKRHYTIG